MLTKCRDGNASRRGSCRNSIYRPGSDAFGFGPEMYLETEDN